ncbi:MAG: nucleotidyltransferase domain-containing protein [Chloroflexi bacterium]|nr:MAG: nucleotidyltransferase domain-containing protein [Chloroflexota bacterium]
MTARHKEMRGTIEQIVKRIVEQYRPEKIFLFGSYAYGKPDAGSDVDLLIVKETGERPIDRRVIVRRIAHTSRRGVPFSPLVITPQELTRRLEMNDPFYRKIIDQGQVMYARP